MVDDAKTLMENTNAMVTLEDDEELEDEEGE